MLGGGKTEAVDGRRLGGEPGLATSDSQHTDAAAGQRNGPQATRPRFLFSINPGRAGSQYLAKLLGTARGVTAFHEPPPDMAGRYVKLFPRDKQTLLARLLYVPIYARKYAKIRAIRKTMRSFPAGEVYAETNHEFILSFYDVAMNHLHPVRVILLRRYLPKIVCSLVSLNRFTPGDRVTRYWYSSPNSPSAAIRAAARDAEMDQVDLCIAYVLDIEARAQRFKRQFPHVPVVEVRVEELNDLAGVRRCFEQLEIEPTGETETVVGEVVNRRTHVKERVGRTLSEEDCLERVRKYVGRCHDQGIELPELPHLEKRD